MSIYFANTFTFIRFLVRLALCAAVFLLQLQDEITDFGKKVTKTTHKSLYTCQSCPLKVPHLIVVALTLSGLFEVFTCKMPFSL